jgi:hypothetical protein
MRGRRVPLAGAEPPRLTPSSCPECGHPRLTPNGAWLRWRREAAGLDQRTLAARLDVSGPYLSDLERNRRTVPEAIMRVYRQLRAPRVKGGR